MIPQTGSSKEMQTMRFNTQSRVHRRRFLPRLEALEDRTLTSTLMVVNTADSGPGSLRDAVAAAAPGDTVAFRPALAGKTITLTSGPVSLTKNLAVIGLGADKLAVSGNGADRVFSVVGTTVSLSGLTITGGLADQGAG